MTDIATRPETSVPATPAPEPSKRLRGGRLQGLIVAGAGLIATAALYAFIFHLQSQDRSPAALGMPDMHMSQMGKFWSYPLLQSAGLVALFVAWLSVMVGLQQSGRGIPWLRLSYRQIDRLHRQLALLVLALVAAHIVGALFDTMGDNWRKVLLFNQWTHEGWPAANWGYDAGVIALYSLVVAAPTFYIRRLIHANRWRVLHRLVLVFYVMSIWHALILGEDIAFYSWVRPAVWLLQIPVLVLLARRVMLPARGRAKAVSGVARSMRWATVAVCAAGVVTAAVIVISGHSGFIESV